MKDHQILRFESPKKNDWYRRRSWLPDEPSLLALYDVTMDTIDTWSDDSDEDDLSDVCYDGVSDDSITTSHGSSPETSDFSDDDVSYEERARRRKEIDRRRKERSSAPKPEDRKAPRRAPSDRIKASTPTNSAVASSERRESNNAKAERATTDRWVNPRLLQILTEEWDMDPRSHIKEAAKIPKGKQNEPLTPAKSSARSSKVPETSSAQTWRSPKGKAPAPTNNNLPPPKRWNPPKSINKNPPNRPPTPRNPRKNAPKRPNSSSSSSNRDFPPRSTWAPPSSNQIAPGISTPTPTSKSTPPRPPNQKVSSPKPTAQHALTTSIRLFAKDQARVSADAVAATQISLCRKAEPEPEPERNKEQEMALPYISTSSECSLLIDRSRTAELPFSADCF